MEVYVRCKASFYVVIMLRHRDGTYTLILIVMLCYSDGLVVLHLGVARVGGGGDGLGDNGW